MGDMAEMWRDYREHKHRIKTRTSARNVRELEALGLVPDRIDQSGSLHFDTPGGVAVYWPSTTRWGFRGKVTNGGPKRFATWLREQRS